MSNTQFKYTRNIKLGPAIGDWTTIQFKDLEIDDIQISSVRNINFDSLPRTEMKQAHLLHYRLAELITSKLSNDLTAKVELHSIQANQMSYSDFLEAQKKQSIVQSKFSLGTLGKMDVILDWSLSEMLVDRLLGGKGSVEGKEKFSGMELKILKTQLDELVPLFSQSWGKVIDESSVSGDFSTGTYVQDKKLSLREAFVLFTLNFYFIDQRLQTITFAYPNHVVKSLLKQKKLLNEPLQKRVSLKETTEQKIKVPVRAVIGETKLTMKELKDLSAGDLVPLNTSLEAPLKVLLGNNTEVQGQVGRVDGKMAVQLLNLQASETTGSSASQATVQRSINSNQINQTQDLSQVASAAAIGAASGAMLSEEATADLDDDFELDSEDVSQAMDDTEDFADASGDLTDELEEDTTDSETAEDLDENEAVNQLESESSEDADFDLGDDFDMDDDLDAGESESVEGAADIDADATDIDADAIEDESADSSELEDQDLDLDDFDIDAEETPAVAEATDIEVDTEADAPEAALESLEVSEGDAPEAAEVAQEASASEGVASAGEGDDSLELDDDDLDDHLDDDDELDDDDFSWDDLDEDV